MTEKLYCTEKDCKHKNACKHNTLQMKLEDIEDLENRKEINSVKCMAEGFIKYFPIGGKKG